jgi:PAS domain S-box-containing protein
MLRRRAELNRQAQQEAIRERDQRQRTEAELRTIEARYRTILDSASDGLLVMDNQGRIIEANSAAAEMYGYTVHELRGRTLDDLIAPTGQRETLEVLRVLAEQGPVRVESHARRRDGSTVDVEIRGGPVIHDDSHSILAILTDVTERHRAEQRHALLARKVLAAQEEERGRIARELHDELGQLLTALRLELDWVRKRGGQAAQEDGQIGLGRALELVENAAAELRRICRGLRPPLLDDLGLDPAVQLLVKEFKERTGIGVSLEVNTEAGEAVLPELALCVYRILQESLTNVNRHAGASRVSVKLTCSSSELLLSVSDDGKGFDPEHAGTGSGLAGMRERARLVDATLNIASEQGKGTSVEVRAPLSSSRGKEAR